MLKLLELVLGVVLKLVYKPVLELELEPVLNPVPAEKTDEVDDAAMVEEDVVKDGVLDEFDPVLVEKTSKLVNAALVDVDKLDDGAAPDPALDAEIVDWIGELEDTVLNSDAVEAESTALIEVDGVALGVAEMANDNVVEPDAIELDKVEDGVAEFIELVGIALDKL